MPVQPALRLMFGCVLFVAVCSFTIATAQDAARSKKEVAATDATVKGAKVFSIGHSFHVFMPGILTDIAKAADVKEHMHLGTSGIGGSRVIQHWDVADDKFKVKANLKEGKVDVLTIAPIFLPDPGIENFATLAFENNPNIRITLQENWLPYDAYTPPALKRVATVDHNAIKIEDLRKQQNEYLVSLTEHVDQLNKKFGKQVIVIVPVGQAVANLREKIVKGEAPGLKEQGDLFTDAIGHAKPPLMALVGYVHYATTYQKSPVGLPTPAVLGAGKNAAYSPELVKLLQELAWQAVTECPASGVKVK
ncbi:hypothetical protein ETAA8_26780 [Anatilimnocola aggregata]|uniref:Uncharacterized protein n=1 Tax=Anatilimnocola aggregata TaxID=2528021 RepID=A0A517YBG7_9BACT|nr:hypothetical protein [Anatilimnocola aggregata]QDU27590.1 hypothetical protein ETAA8_26780 [Anatilimnocola aggregata]